MTFCIMKSHQLRQLGTTAIDHWSLEIKIKTTLLKKDFVNLENSENSVWKPSETNQNSKQKVKIK